MYTVTPFGVLLFEYHHHHHHWLYSPVGPWPPQANVASDLYPGHPPANFYNPVLASFSTPSINLDFGWPRPL
jgi:hypothetical protein